MKWLLTSTSLVLAIGSFAMDGLVAVALALGAVATAGWYAQRR